MLPDRAQICQLSRVRSLLTCRNIKLPPAAASVADLQPVGATAPVFICEVYKGFTGTGGVVFYANGRTALTYRSDPGGAESRDAAGEQKDGHHSNECSHARPHYQIGQKLFVPAPRYTIGLKK